jgi:hypothetical protein
MSLVETVVFRADFVAASFVAAATVTRFRFFWGVADI